MKKLIKKDFWFLLLTVFAVPVFYVQALTLGQIVTNIKGLIDDIIPLIVGLALVYFIYGIAQYIGNSGDAAKKEEGKTRMTWGIIALFVIISVWGLVKILQNTIWGNDPSAFQAAPKPDLTK